MFVINNLSLKVAITSMIKLCECAVELRLVIPTDYMCMYEGDYISIRFVFFFIRTTVVIFCYVLCKFIYLFDVTYTLEK